MKEKNNIKKIISQITIINILKQGLKIKSQKVIHKYGPEGCLYLSELFEDASIDDMLEGLKQADEMIKN